MVQEFNVLKCYTCKTFQVHQVKKVKQWHCKVCGERQSTKKIYARGSGADCRKHVQKLNTMQGEYERVKGEKSAEIENEALEEKQSETTSLNKFVRSKWEKFLVESQNIEDSSQQHESWIGLPVKTNCSVIEKQQQNGRHKRMKNEDSSSIVSTKKKKLFYQGNRYPHGHFELPPHDKDTKSKMSPCKSLHHTDPLHSSTHTQEQQNLSFQNDFRPGNIDKHSQLNDFESKPFVTSIDGTLNQTLTSQTRREEDEKTPKNSKWSRFLEFNVFHSSPSS